MRPKGLLFRALREDEVQRDANGGAKLVDNALRPKARGSNMSVARAVGVGSTVHDSPYVHTTVDILTAVYFATSPSRGAGGGSGLIAVLDDTRMKEAGTTLIDLNKTATRRVYGIEPGSKEEGAAVAAAEVLINADEVQDGLLVGGLLDVRGVPR